MDPESSPPNIPEYTGNHTKHKSFLVKKRSPEGEGEVENQSDPSDLANTTENVYKKEVIDDDLPVVARTSSNGDVHEEYKATDGEAWPIQETTIVVSAMETSSISNTSHPIATEDDPQAHEAVMLLTSSSNLVEQSDVTTDSTGSENASHPSLDENKWSDAEMTGNTRTEEVAASVESSPDAKDIGMEGVTAQPGKVSGDEFAAEIAGTEETSSETAIVHGDSSQQEATATLGVRVLVTSPAPVIDSHVAINAETSDAILPSEQVSWNGRFPVQNSCMHDVNLNANQDGFDLYVDPRDHFCLSETRWCSPGCSPISLHTDSSVGGARPERSRVHFSPPVGISNEYFLCAVHNHGKACVAAISVGGRYHDERPVIAIGKHLERLFLPSGFPLGNSSMHVLAVIAIRSLTDSVSTQSVALAVLAIGSVAGMLICGYRRFSRWRARRHHQAPDEFGLDMTIDDYKDSREPFHGEVGSRCRIGSDSSLPY